MNRRGIIAKNIEDNTESEVSSYKWGWVELPQLWDIST